MRKTLLAFSTLALAFAVSATGREAARSAPIKVLVITGDKTQVDLPKREDSGLMQIDLMLPGIDGIAIQYFTEVDVVRHRLVRDIIRAYADDAGE